MRLPSRLAVLSHYLPPNDSGQALMLHRLFCAVSPEDYCLLSFPPLGGFDHDRQCFLPSLPAKHYELPHAFQLRLRSKLGTRPAREVANFFLEAIQGSTRIINVLKQERCESLMAFSGGGTDLLSAYIASRKSCLPLLVYAVDYWRYQFHHPFYLSHLPMYRHVAKYIEPIIIKGAEEVIVLNELLQDEYRRRYGARPVVIRNPCDPIAMHGHTDNVWPETIGEIKIVFTGQIYDAHFDAFRNLISAMDQLDNVKAVLHLYTSQNPAVLENVGILGPVVIHGHVPPPQVYEVQRRADILFLPLAFDSPYPEIVRTSAPTKMGEYLASGRPILVHAPANTFLTRYFTQYGCGVVVDHGEPEALAEAIRRICESELLRERLCARARARAIADFRLESAQAALLNLLQSQRPA
jgi:glycosyltransferase involved in cell wall biosynthesis